MRPNTLGIVLMVLVFASACRSQNESSENKDRELVDKQQKIYSETQPVHIYDYSIPRDIYQQIYDFTTTNVVATYTVIESITGVTRYECPSMGYPIPADTSLTNPLQGQYNVDNVGMDEFSVVVEQAEPNGLFSSKNTDATWVLCVNLESGDVYPVYNEHKTMTFPFICKKDENGQWWRDGDQPVKFKINIRTKPEKE